MLKIKNKAGKTVMVLKDDANEPIVTIVNEDPKIEKELKEPQEEDEEEESKEKGE